VSETRQRIFPGSKRTWRKALSIRSHASRRIAFATVSFFLKQNGILQTFERQPEIIPAAAVAISR
jgi:hypothetical protein